MGKIGGKERLSTVLTPGGGGATGDWRRTCFCSRSPDHSRRRGERASGCTCGEGNRGWGRWEEGEAGGAREGGGARAGPRRAAARAGSRRARTGTRPWRVGPSTSCRRSSGPLQGRSGTCCTVPSFVSAARGLVESHRNINQLAVVAHQFCRERHSAGRPSGRDIRSSVRVPGIFEPLARDRELLLRERAARSKRGQQEGRERGRRAGRGGGGGGGAAARRRGGAAARAAPRRWPAARLDARRGCSPASSPPRARA